MTLNCKVGDLAIVVRSKAGNKGKVVRCIELVTGFGYVLGRPIDSRLGALWKVDSPMRFTDGYGNFVGEERIAADSNLRPIRPLDEPETITTDDEVMA